MTDLLEEEIILPGESRDNSASVARGGAVEKPKNWAYLPPRSPSTSTTSSSDSYKVGGDSINKVLELVYIKMFLIELFFLRRNIFEMFYIKMFLIELFWNSFETVK